MIRRAVRERTFRARHWLSRARLHLEDSRKGVRDPLLPPRRMNLPSQAPAVGERLVEDMRQHCALTPSSDVLDMGCGPGRVAAPLTRFLDPAQGSYEGFDVMPKSIKWCREAITPKHPSFRFQLADIHNAQYNPKGTQRADGYVFPYDDESFDVALAASLFTHLRPFEGERYLREARRVLRPGARQLSTWFLIDGETDELLSGARSAPSRDAPKLDHEFTDERGNRFRSPYAEAPEHMIAIDGQLVRDQHERAGLEIVAVIRGSWREGPGGGWPGQDMIVSRRAAE